MVIATLFAFGVGNGGGVLGEFLLELVDPVEFYVGAVLAGHGGETGGLFDVGWGFLFLHLVKELILTMKEHKDFIK